MSAFPEAARALTDAAARRDRLGAWDAAARLLPWIADLRNRIDARQLRTLIWTGAACNRWFDIAEVLSGAGAARADAQASLRRLHAQMLMERGYHDEALARLSDVLARMDASAYDRGEALGHIGRINKERFLAASRARDEQGALRFLQQAVEAYLPWYLAHRSPWHGINAAALLSRPEAIAFDRDAPVKGREIAQEILRNKGALEGDVYRDAALAESYIALGEFAPALESVRSYISDMNTSGFQLGSLHRQLIQVWELDRRGSPWPEMVAMIGSAVLEREGAVLELSAAELQRAKEVTRTSYEAVFGGDRFDSYDNYRRGLERCACVARIGRSADTGVGTGFVIPGRLISAKLGDGFVLMTNAHVISEAEELRQTGALHPVEAVITFAALDGVREKEFQAGAIIFSSPPEELDVTVMELTEPVLAKERYRIAPVLPARGSDAKVRVVGHPSGRGLSLSVNSLLDYDGSKLHYRTATEGGSSGSPVFNQEWNLIGLHHAGGEQMPKLNGQPGTYQANEGIWIRAICEAVEKKIAMAKSAQ